ncbi:MAG: type II toxin-antitoxin system VapC family toxin [Rhodocyclaceae bacterium]|nr:type II toxin-antitoxin system VapC family toxin [Rhodocyclaceae bacterium]
MHTVGQQAEGLVVSVICLPELVSTLSRLVREKRCSKSVYQKLKANALTDLSNIDICQITPEVLVSVVLLLESNPLRAMDAIHVACALVYQPDIFASADHRQLSAASKAGIKVVDVS